MFSSPVHRVTLLGFVALALSACADQPIGGFDRPRYVAEAAQAQTDLRFVPGSARLAAGEADRFGVFLRGLVLRPSDDLELTFGPSGSTVLERQRIAAVEAAIARAGTPARVLISDTRGFGRGVDRGDLVLVRALRHDVLVVDCGTMGMTPAEIAGNQLPPIGCANETNLAHMAASVRDLTHPRVLGPAPAALAAAPLVRGSGQVPSPRLD